MEEDHPEFPCPRCGGSGIDPEPEHGHHPSCDGNCKYLCPEISPKPCEFCAAKWMEKLELAK